MVVDVEAWFGAFVREAEIDEGGCDYMECRTVFAASGEEWQNLGDLDEAPWPAMNEAKRNGVLDGAALMDEVHTEGAEIVNRDVNGVLGKAVEMLLSFAPVIACLPPFCQTSYVL